MVLVDTSIWIDHLRKRISLLEDFLLEEKVVIHPIVIGEIACGSLSNRDEIISLLNALPKVVEATNDEVHSLIQSKQLYGKGLGWIDVHLLASCSLSKVSLWTRDKRLEKEGQRIGISRKRSRGE